MTEMGITCSQPWPSPYPGLMVWTELLMATAAMRSDSNAEEVGISIGKGILWNTQEVPFSGEILGLALFNKKDQVRLLKLCQGHLYYI